MNQFLTVFKTETEFTEDSGEGGYEEESYDEEIEDEDENEKEDQTKANDTKEKSDSEDEESKQSKQRKKIRSQSVKQPTQVVLPNQNHRGSLLGEDLLNRGQQRRSLLLQAFDEKIPSAMSINRLPSIGSRANRQSILDPKMKEQINRSLYEPMGTINETDITNDNKKKERSEIKQNIVQDYMYFHYQQQLQQKQKQNEDYNEDRVCSYEIYFPHNNVRNIIDEIERQKKKFRSKSIGRQRRTGLNNRLISLKQLHTLKTMFADKFDTESHQNISIQQNMD